MVWQKSNETDFLLTINFILFTNQGYLLQNSSLGQVHSDVGVASIVRSSAGRLLLVYLSARRLRSSGYYIFIFIVRARLHCEEVTETIWDRL